MSKIIATVTVALVTTIAASSAFAGGCHDSYSYDTYTAPYVSYDSVRLLNPDQNPSPDNATMEAPMSKIIATVTVALVTTIAASSAFAGGCHDSYSYDTYTAPYVSYDFVRLLRPANGPQNREPPKRCFGGSLLLSRRYRPGYAFRSAATFSFRILSGFCTGSPRLILSTLSMPSVDLAPDRVLAVEEARVVEADEELAVGAVGALRTRHRAACRAHAARR